MRYCRRFYPLPAIDYKRSSAVYTVLHVANVILLLWCLIAMVIRNVQSIKIILTYIKCFMTASSPIAVPIQTPKNWKYLKEKGPNLIRSALTDICISVVLAMLELEPHQIHKQLCAVGYCGNCHWMDRVALVIIPCSLVIVWTLECVVIYTSIRLIWILIIKVNDVQFECHYFYWAYTFSLWSSNWSEMAVASWQWSKKSCSPTWLLQRSSTFDTAKTSAMCQLLLVNDQTDWI